MSRRKSVTDQALRQAEGALFLLGGGTDHPPRHSGELDFTDALLEKACALFQTLT